MTIHRTTDPPVTINVRVNLERLNALQDYAREHGTTMAEAFRRAIDALMEKDAATGK